MAIAQSILPEFKHEMTNTRRVLERVPEAHAAWKPHAKSYSLGELALHIANIAAWAPVTIKDDELDFDKANNQASIFPRVFTTREALLAVFDKNMSEAVDAISSASDDVMRNSWTLKSRGKVVFSLPRVAVLRSFVMNHLIHHRGQLTVYLRMKDVPLPAIYGNTADER